MLKTPKQERNKPETIVGIARYEKTVCDIMLYNSISCKLSVLDGLTLYAFKSLQSSLNIQNWGYLCEQNLQYNNAFIYQEPLTVL